MAPMTADLLDRARSVLVVVDVQEKLMPHIHAAAPLQARLELLLDAAVRLGVPVIVTEQYPQGLGPTVPAIRAALPAGDPVVKTDFSCAPVPAFRERLAAVGRSQVVLAGIEAHVCVAQTALELAGGGAAVWVVADAVGSRRPLDRDTAIERFRAAGVGVVTAESVVFEWLRRAGTPEFKALSPRIRDLA